MTPQIPELVAAADLGTNSFHLVVTRIKDGHVEVVDRLREMVRLGAGLDESKRLTPEAQSAALDCLERFGQRLRDMPRGTVRVVGTNTLRMARNGEAFLALAEQVMGHPIDIISGVEEARLIYQGVAHCVPHDGNRRLVLDIGGGSTELAVGEGYETLDVESLYMGCVSMSQRYFPDGAVGAKDLRSAEIAARLELRPVARRLDALQWTRAIGTSGTILTAAELLRARGWSENGISRSGLQQLREALLAAGRVDAADFPEVPERRRPVFAGGVAILLAAFESLEIEQLALSEWALREGLVYDLVGRIRHEDIRQHTVDLLARRYENDEAQAQRVRDTALQLLAQVASTWALNEEDDAKLLRWAARLHEIGLCVAHSQYHKHGAYLVEQSDLAGFARHEQQLLAALIRGHRRKFPAAVFDKLPTSLRQRAIRLCVLLRLAVRLHRERSDRPLPDLQVRVSRRGLKLSFPEGWLQEHPLSRADLKEEVELLRAAGLRLKVR